MKWICIVAAVGMCLFQPACISSQKPAPDPLTQLKFLVENGEYQKAVLFFKEHDPRGGYDDTPYVDEFLLLGSRAYTQLAINEPDKAKRDELFKKALQALSRW